jgi:glucose-6-phosphate 1-epimerase
MTVLPIHNAACTAEIHLNGAHITSWHPRGAGEVLWLSERAVFAPGVPIRGGIPLCWPWFGPHPSDPLAKAHGFARTREWTLDQINEAVDETHVRLVLRSDDETRALWPHEFELLLDAVFGVTLDVALTTRNIGAAPFTITEALHTYLGVSDVRSVAVDGLAGARYADKVVGCDDVQSESLLRFSGETDRVYATANDCVVINGARRVRITKRGSGSTVVWNPWIEKAARMADFGDDEWTSMLCVEAANALDAAVTVAPGALHTIATTIQC